MRTRTRPVKQSSYFFKYVNYHVGLDCAALLLFSISQIVTCECHNQRHIIEKSVECHMSESLL